MDQFGRPELAFNIIIWIEGDGSDPLLGVLLLSKVDQTILVWGIRLEEIHKCGTPCSTHILFESMCGAGTVMLGKNEARESTRAAREP